MRITPLFLLLLVVVVRSAQAQTPPDLVTVAQEIALEASLVSQGPTGRPLPLANHWNTGLGKNGFSPDFQLAKIDAGSHIMVTSHYPWPNDTISIPYWEAYVRRCAELRLPLAFLGSQWEAMLYTDGYPFYSLPAPQNPNVLTLSGAIRERLLDPLAPVQPWSDAGKMFGSQLLFRHLEAIYPDPPAILFISNNEASWLGWGYANESKRFVDAYGTETTDDFRKFTLRNGIFDRQRALIDGFRAALPTRWQSRARFGGYNAFGPATFGLPGWWYWTPLSYGRINFSPAVVWGASLPGYYLVPDYGSRDDELHGIQFMSQSWVFMLKDTLVMAPDFWFGLTTWDSEEAGRLALSDVIPFTPERYGAVIKFGMWQTRPRLVQEFRWWLDTVANAGIWFDAVLAAVDGIYSSSTLKRFWRMGTLVPNSERKNPFQVNITDYESDERSFILSTTADPAGWPFSYPYRVKWPVIAIAHVLGEVGSREWLMYAQAPTGFQPNVGISIPGYGRVTVDVPVQGAYYLVREKQSGAELIRTDGPRNLSISPSAGSGPRRVFTFKFRDPDGALDISWVQILINRQLLARGGCYIHFNNTSNYLWLYDDNAQGGGGLTPGSTSTVANGQCILAGRGSAVSRSGNLLTLTLDVTFRVDGALNIYMQALDGRGNLAGWERAGTWTAVTDVPRIASVSPSSGSGASQLFTIVARDPDGASTLSWVQFLITADGSATNACYVHYQQSSNTLWLYDDAAVGGTALRPGSGTAYNSQCILKGGGSSVAASGMDLTVKLDLTFKTAFAGGKRLWAQTLDAAANLAPWTAMGSWTVVQNPNLPSIVSVSPRSGSGASQLFTIVARDPNGASTLSWVQFLITADGLATNACYVHYQQSSNTLWLYDDAVVGGTALRQGGSGNAQNSQCMLKGAGSSVAASGTDLTIKLDLTFKSAFAGGKRLWAQTLDAAANLAPWTAMGSWIVP